MDRELARSVLPLVERTGCVGVAVDAIPGAVGYYQRYGFVLLRMIGIWLAVPLFAFVLSPWVVCWLALEAGRSYLGLPDRWVEYQSVTAQIVGFVWLAVVLGRLCPRRGRVRQVVLRCRTVFLDWVLEPANPQAARRERARCNAAVCRVPGQPKAES